MVVRNQIKTHKPWESFPRLFCLLLMFFITPILLSAQYTYEFSPAVRSAYDAALSLRFEEAKTQCANIRKADPNNLIIYFVEDYIDFFTVFINEDYEEFKRLEKNKGDRLQKIRQGSSQSPYFNYCQAEIQLHWALARLKFEEYFTAFIEVKNAYKLLQQNEEQFPNFIANKKSLGVLHAFVGTIPDNYKWGVKLLGGMEGTIEQGQQEIESVIEYSKNNDFFFKEETGVMYSYLILHLRNNTERAWNAIESLKLNHKENPLAAFAMANIALRTGRTDKAIKFLQERPQSEEFAKFPYLNYLLGLAKLYRQDPDASFYLQKFIDEFNGMNYIKEAYQKIGWQCLIEGKEQCYLDQMQKCLKYGGNLIGGDKMAMREAQNGIIPNATLTKARVLFDGGYYLKARDILVEAKSNFQSGTNRLAYLYRLGRVYQNLGQKELALANYLQTISEGRYKPEYYACNAALQLGFLYEQGGDYTNAAKYFNQCLQMKPSEYRSSLHQKAKAGLDRMGK